MPLTLQELDAFLAEPRMPVVTTPGPAVNPHPMPGRYAWHGGQVLFPTGPDSKNPPVLRANARFSVAVNTKVAPESVNVIEGGATGPAGGHALAMEIAPPGPGEKPGRRPVQPTGGRGSLVAVRPGTITSRARSRESNP